MASVRASRKVDINVAKSQKQSNSGSNMVLTILLLLFGIQHAGAVDCVAAGEKNTAECICGVITCPADSGGFYCMPYVGGGTCSKYLLCNKDKGNTESTNQQDENHTRVDDGKCLCAPGVLCDSTTGYYCYQYGGICSNTTIDVCPNIKGSTLEERNAEPCQCGGERCNANELCIAHEKWDPDKPRCAAKFNSYSIQNAAIEWIAGLKDNDTSTAEAKWGHPKDWDLSQVDTISKLFHGGCSTYPVKSNFSTANKHPCKDPVGSALFNADLSNWNVGKVTNAESAFGSSPLFDSDVSKWNVAKMKTINRMFGWAPKFNSDVSKWDVSKVTAAASFMASSTQSRKWATTAWCKSAAYGEKSVENHIVCCMKGEYLDPALTLTYYDFKNEDTCTKCPKGKVQGEDRVVVSSCTDCLRDEFSSAIGLPSCSPCDTSLGEYSSPGSAVCLKCPAGKKTSRGVNATTCEACPIGKFQADAGQNDCDKCPKGYHNNDASGLGYCFRCLVGKYQNQTGQENCVTCDAGTKRGVDDLPETVCKDCTPGQYQSATSAGDCLPCIPGKKQASSKAISCTDCPQHTFNEISAQSECVSCSAGQFTDAPGRTSCQNCGAGQYSLFNVCSKCPLGWKRGEMDTSLTACHKCQIGETTTVAGSTFCEKCPVGTFGTQHGATVGCVACPPGFITTEPGASTPEPCPPGTYTSNNGSVSCFPCAPGMYSAGNASKTCELCPAGFLQDTSRQSSCDPVEPGKIVADGGGTSIEVPLGSRIVCNGAGGACSSFLACEPGTYGETPKPGKSCLLCPAGYGSTKSATSCNPCGKGRYGDVRGTACKECAAGQFQGQNVQPSTVCMSCPSGWIQPDIGTSLCIDLNWPHPSDCNSDEYLDVSLPEQQDWTCKVCPPGGFCGDNTATSDSLKPKFGYYRCPSGAAAPSLEFEACLGAACRGAPNFDLRGIYFRNVTNGSGVVDVATLDELEGCGDGHVQNRTTNVRCSRCQPGRALVPDIGDCVACTPDKGVTFVTLTTLAAAVIFVVFIGLKLRNGRAKRKAVDSTMKRTLLTHLQMLTIIMSLNVPWPPAVDAFLDLVARTTSTTIKPAMLTCMTEEETDSANMRYTVLIISSLLPVAMFALSYVYWILLVPLCCRCLSCGKRLQTSNVCPSCKTNGGSHWSTKSNDGGGSDRRVSLTTIDGWITTNVYFLYLLAPSILRLGFQMLENHRVCGVQLSALDDSVAYLSARHLFMVRTVAVPSLAMYGVVCPALAITYIGLHGDRQENRKLMFRFGLLYSGYSESYWWYEVILFLRKVMLIVVVTFASTNELQLHMAMGMLIVLLFLQEHLRPFDDGAHGETVNTVLHRMEAFSMFVLLAMCWSAVYFHHGVCEAAGWWCTVLAFVVLAANGAFVVAAVYVFTKKWAGKHHLMERIGKIASSMGILTKELTEEEKASRSEAINADFDEGDGTELSKIAAQHSSKLHTKDSSLRPNHQKPMRKSPVFDEGDGTELSKMAALHLPKLHTKDSPLRPNHLKDGKRPSKQLKAKKGRSKKSKAKDWLAAVDNKTGKLYYYNRRTRETTWIMPKDLTTDRIRTNSKMHKDKRRRSSNLYQLQEGRGVLL